MIGIREYYPKDGEMLSGAKVCLHRPHASLNTDNSAWYHGISMPIHQSALFVRPEVEVALIARGQTVRRPLYEVAC